jgi:hypothetical protein
MGWKLGSRYIGFGGSLGHVLRANHVVTQSRIRRREDAKPSVVTLPPYFSHGVLGGLTRTYLGDVPALSFFCLLSGAKQSIRAQGTEPRRGRIV